MADSADGPDGTEPTPPPAVAARELGFAYGEREVLAGLTFDVAPGEVLGILGPNGAGKSTLLRVLSGVLAGYRGEVSIDGREVREMSRRDLARRLAVVPQETRVELPFSALEVVLLGRHPHLEGFAFEAARDLEIAHRALARCGADELASRPVQELSAGERQRVLFSRALAQEPRLLLLDEAVAFLDLRYQVELCERVRELAAGGVAVVTALHDLNLAGEFCDRLLILDGGRLAACGTPAEVLTYPLLTRVYRTEIYVDVHDLTAGLVVTPLSERARRELARSGGTIAPREPGPADDA